MRRPVMVKHSTRLWYLTEALVADQDNNVVIVYLSKLSDGETWEYKAWLPPSMIRVHGGFHDPVFMNRMDITDSCFKEMRLKGISEFLLAEEAIRLNKHQITLPDDLLQKLQAAHHSEESPVEAEKENPPPGVGTQKGGNLPSQSGSETGNGNNTGHGVDPGRNDDLSPRNNPAA